MRIRRKSALVEIADIFALASVCAGLIVVSTFLLLSVVI
jgi:hypothetical protein